MAQRTWRSTGRFKKGFIPKNKGVRTPCFCASCEVEFYPLDQVKRVYCCKGCQSTSYKTGLEHHSWDKDKSREYVCEECDMVFRPKSHGDNYKFCSIECRGKHYSGDNQWNWKGGITEENHKIRTSTEYKLWRMSVLQRDMFSCVACGYRSKGKNSRDVVVDHIQPFSLFPELRFDMDNGRTLCRNCDAILGWNYYRDGGKK